MITTAASTPQISEKFSLKARRAIRPVARAGTTAIRAAGVWGFEGAFLTEPVTFPSNVEGGLGLVSVASASDISLALPELE